MQASSDANSISELRYIYEHFDQHHDMPLWVGVSRCEQAESRICCEIVSMLSLPASAVVACDPRNREAMQKVLHAFIHSLACSRESALPA